MRPGDIFCIEPGAETSVTPIANRRKNWLHLGSNEAGPKIAAIFSVAESCRRLNIPIREIPDRHPSGTGQSLHPNRGPTHTRCLRSKPRKIASPTTPPTVNYVLAGRDTLYQRRVRMDKRVGQELSIRLSVAT